MPRRLTGTVVIATHNPGKLREMAELLAPYGIEAVSAGDLGLTEPAETGTMFAENAAIKARAAAQAANLPAFADDSGLCVDALDGAPGIHSARWAGPERDFDRAMRLVEEKLASAGAHEPRDRRAQFVCALALALPEGAVETFVGCVHGTLVWPPRGSQGFGYDPIFLPDGFERTFGEMSPEEKHGWRPGAHRPLSHRARAFAAFAQACLGARAG